MQKNMILTSMAIAKPISTFMACAAVLLFGALSLFKVPVDLLPDVSFPVIAIQTRIAGYSPPEVETVITKPIEAAVSTMNGVRRVRSTSTEGLSLVQIEFKLGTNMDFASAAVRERIDGIRDAFPKDARNSHVRKYNPAEAPIMAVAAYGDANVLVLRQVVEEHLEKRLKRIEGVGNLEIKGGGEREIIIEIDHGRLKASGLSIGEIARTLEANNLNAQVGAVSKSDSRLVARVEGEFSDLSQIENLGLKRTSAGSIVFLKDIGRVSDSHRPAESLTRFQGEPRVMLYVQKESGANVIRVSDALKREMLGLKDALPEALRLEIIYDQAEYIKASIQRLRDAALIGAALAMAVVFLFLRNFQSILIIGAAVPISIIGTFTLMSVFGITLNILSLSGFTLGVGMLVDNAIVVIENISKKRRLYRDKLQSALIGSAEVARAISVSTFAHIAVFLPVIFLQQKIRMLYSGLFFTVSFSLLASLLVALTVVPLMSSRMRLKPLWSGERHQSGRRMYRKFLLWSLRHRGKVILGGALLFFASLLLLPRIGFEPMARMDRGIFNVAIRTPPGTSLSATDEAARGAERILIETAEVKDFSSEVNKESVRIRVRLVSDQERSKTTREVVEELRPKFALLPRAQVHFDVITGISAGNKITIHVTGYDQEKLLALASQMKQKLAAMEDITDVVIHQANPVPELQVRVIRDKAGVYGLDASRIAEAVRSGITGPVATEFLEKGKEVDLRVRLQKEDILTLSVLDDISIPVTMDSGKRTLVPLGEICTFRYVPGVAEIHRKDQRRMIRISADIGRLDLGRTAEKVAGELKDLVFPEGYDFDFGEDYQELKESKKEMAFTFLLAVLLVYMILASLFESFLYPLAIVFSVPMAAVGSIIALYATGTTINVPVYVGAITLAGIVVNNAVVLIDYIHLLKSRGVGKWRAVIRGAESRLRPILMTSGTTLVALLPMALDKGEGSNLWSPLALTIIGGLVTSTVLTLIILPLIASYIEDVKTRGGE